MHDTPPDSAPPQAPAPVDGHAQAAAAEPAALPPQAPEPPQPPELPETPELPAARSAAPAALAAPEAAAADDQPGSKPGAQGRKPRIDLDAVAAELKARFPALFGGAPKPIKLRIQADIQARAPEVFTRQALSLFLHRHTTSTLYLIALSQQPHRLDLDGQPAGEVAAEHRDAAALEVERRRAGRRGPAGAAAATAQSGTACWWCAGAGRATAPAA